jgi:hypothetical protein
MKQSYSGGCQCGKVRYEVQAEINEVYACNCSRCGKLGTLLTFTSPEDFKLISGEGATSEYQFNKKLIHHLFCATCGVQSYSRGTSPGSGNEMVAINVRCLDDVDPESFPVKKFDGKNLL